MKPSKLLLSLCLLFAGQTLKAGCDAEDVTLFVDCAAIGDHFTVSDDVAELVILDEDGNHVPNPIPLVPVYFCKTLTVLAIVGDDTCSSTISIQTTGPEIQLAEFESVTAQNYAADNVPPPIIMDCTQGIRVYDYHDDIIGACDEVPRVKRTYTAYDKCGNTSTAVKYFNVIPELACTIIGPSRISAGVPVEFKLQKDPKGIFTNPVWNIKGKDWIIDFDKLNDGESKIRVLAGPNAAPEAELELDLFDLFGCQRSCYKVINVIRNNRFLGMQENSADNYQISFGNEYIRLADLKQNFVSAYRIFDLSGRLVSFNRTLPGGNIDISLAGIPQGLFLISLQTQDGPVTYKFTRL